MINHLYSFQKNALETEFRTWIFFKFFMNRLAQPGRCKHLYNQILNPNVCQALA